MSNLILASASPRRSEILKNSGFNFRIMPSNYDEKICGQNFSLDLVENCAYLKAADVFNKNPKICQNSTIIAADTVVVLDEIILGKPKNKTEAFSMLENLSNRTHFVATSICLLNHKKSLKKTQKTNVTFRKLKKSEILNYIKTKNPLDKAGSYGIQDENFDFAISVDGDLDNVIGFPIKMFKSMLARF